MSPESPGNTRPRRQDRPLQLEDVKLAREDELHDGVHRSRLPNHLVAELGNPDAAASDETLHERRTAPAELRGCQALHADRSRVDHAVVKNAKRH